MHPKVPARFGAAAAFALVLPFASAQVAIPGADRAGPSPAQPGDGLNGVVWFGSGHTIADAQSIMAGAPAGSFRSTSVDYPNGAAGDIAIGSPLSTFLGTDSASVVGFDPAGVDSGAKVFTFSGFITIAEAGLYRFGVASDDGMRLRIGSQTVLAYDGDRGFDLSTELAEFEQPGLYPIDLLYWANHAGASGVELRWNPDITEPLVVIPQSELYTTVPSPGSVALLGMAGMALVRRRR